MYSAAGYPPMSAIYLQMMQATAFGVKPMASTTAHGIPQKAAWDGTMSLSQAQSSITLTTQQMLYGLS